MVKNKNNITVAGHICLDIFPSIHSQSNVNNLLVPGQLNEIGRSSFFTGGVVSNTGQALERLGINTNLIGKVGNDEYSKILLNKLQKESKESTKYMSVSDEDTSYSIVLNFQDTDRIFLHYAGANDTFSSKDIDTESYANSRIFHFGYPPLMFEIRRNNGEELVKILRAAKEKGVITTLDMAMPDPNIKEGDTDWRKLLEHVLPYVDFFTPSLDEIIFMMDKPKYEELMNNPDKPLNQAVEIEYIHDMCNQLLKWGTKGVLLKLGDQGLYFKTGDSVQELKDYFGDNCDMWINREIVSPCFKTNIKGTTGSGDSTIAGFLLGLFYHFNPEQAITSAVAVGAYCCEAEDALSGIKDW